MKRIAYLLLLTVILWLGGSRQSLAQDHKLRIGFTLAPTFNISQGILQVQSPAAVLDSLKHTPMGWKGGVTADYMLGTHSMIHLGLNLHAKQYRWGTALENVEVTTIEMPLGYKWEAGLGRLLRMYLFGGGAAEYNLQAQLQDLTDLTPELNKITYSAVLSTGASLSLGFGYFKVGASYFLGLNELLRDPSLPLVNPDHLSIDIGFSFN